MEITFPRKSIAGQNRGEVAVTLIHSNRENIRVKIDDGERFRTMDYNPLASEDSWDDQGNLNFNLFVEHVIKPDYKAGNIMPIPIF